MVKQETIKRYIIFFIGLFINSFGISFITKAGLGTSPISSIPYTMSLRFEPTIGMFTLYMSGILILLQLLLLKKDFPKQYYLQIPISFAFSWFIDLTMDMLSFMVPGTYPAKIISLFLGCFLLGTGVYIEMLADVVMLPGEALVKAISVTFCTDFGKTKVAVDTSLMLLAAIIGWIFFQRLAGIREGTVIAALLVGTIARFLKRRLLSIEKLLFSENACPKETAL